LINPSGQSEDCYFCLIVTSYPAILHSFSNLGAVYRMVNVEANLWK